MSKPLPKLYVIRKYVWATSAEKAMKVEKNQKADDCWLDEQFKVQSLSKDVMGFRLP